MDNAKKIAIGADHGGYLIKESIKKYLNRVKLTTKDFGTDTEESVDYPDFAHPVATAVKNGEFDFGILVCGSGNGVAITANKHEGIRAGLAWNKDVAKLIKEHNNANVICIPGRFVSEKEAVEIVKAFMNAEFLGGRHSRRIDKINC